jgi:hypothetical protein
MKINDRVQLHPATDSWMKGDRFGTITKISKGLVSVLLDTSCSIKKFSVENLELTGDRMHDFNQGYRCTQCGQYEHDGDFCKG